MLIRTQCFFAHGLKKQCKIICKKTWVQTQGGGGEGYGWVWTESKLTFFFYWALPLSRSIGSAKIEHILGNKHEQFYGVEHLAQNDF